MSTQFTPTAPGATLAAATGVANPAPNATRFKVSNTGTTWIYVAFAATAAQAAAAAAAPAGEAPNKNVFAVAPNVSEIVAVSLDAQGNSAYFAASAACFIQPGN